MLGHAALLTTLLLAATHQPKVVVLDIHDTTGRDGSLAKVLSQVMASEAVRPKRFDVVTQRVIGEVLGLERQRQLLGCTESSCMAEIGAALGADYILSGELGRLGSQFRFDLTLIDGRRSRVAAQRGGFEKSEGGLGESVGQTVRQLFIDAKLLDDAPTPAVPLTSKVEAQSPGPSHTGAWVSFGLAGALAVGAGVMTGLAIKDYGALRAGDPASSGRHQLNEARLADALWAGALVSGAVGSYLYLSAAPSDSGSGGEIFVGGTF